MTDAIGDLELIRNTPIPPPYDIFVRVINWCLEPNFCCRVGVHGFSADRNYAVFRVLIAERIGAYMEGFIRSRRQHFLDTPEYGLYGS